MSPSRVRSQARQINDENRRCTICNKPILHEPWMTGRDVVQLIKRELHQGNDEVHDLLHEVDLFPIKKYEF